MEKLPISPYFYISSTLFAIGIVLFLYATYKGLKALGIRKYSLGPDPKDFAEKWAETKEEDTLVALMLSLIKSSEQVSVINDEQAKNLESAHRYLVLGLLFTFLFVLSLIFAKLLNGMI